MTPTQRHTGARSGAPPSPASRRWLLVGDLPPPESGSALAFEVLCRELERRGYRHRVVDHARHRHSAPSQLSLVRGLEMLGILGRFALGLLGSQHVYLIISQSRAGFLRDMLMVWGAVALRRTVVVHLHGGNYDGFYQQQSRPWRFLIRAMLRRTRRIIALSERLRGMCAFDPAALARVVVVPNGPPAALPGRARAWPPGGARTVRLLYMSNLIQSKGYVHVLDAAALLRQEPALPFELVFAGRFMASIDDDEALSPAAAERRFLGRIEAAGLGDVVRYVGPMTGRPKWRLFEESDFFLLPTNYRHEGQPLSIIEAMAHGCVVVATAFRAIPDMVVDGVTGVLVEYGQPPQIAAAVRRIAADRARFNAMSSAAVRRYQDLFTQQRHLAAMVAVLDSE